MPYRIPAGAKEALAGRTTADLPTKEPPSGACRACAYELAAPWRFCPACGLGRDALPGWTAPHGVAILPWHGIVPPYGGTWTTSTGPTMHRRALAGREHAAR